MQDDEKFKGINQQLHILSAKFVRFSSQINNLILDFNREKNGKIKPSNYVDTDASNFIAHKSPTCDGTKTTGRKESTNHSVAKPYDRKRSERTQSSTHGSTNIYANGKLSAGQLKSVHNKHAYSKSLKVHLRNANIVNIDTFTDDLKENIEETIGHNVIDKININKYSMANGIIWQIIVIISFRVPLSYQYMNEFSFPTNWHFFAYGTKQNGGDRRNRHQQHNQM